MKDFIIKFKGLATSLHEFSYLLDEDFFKELGEEDFAGGNISVKILLSKEETMLTFNFYLQGSVTVVCDRCLDTFDMPIDSNERLYVKFGDENVTDSDEIIYIPETDYQIDIFEYIRQALITLLPIQKAHPNDGNGNSTCNKNMLERIRKLSIENTAQEEDVTDKIDPRWEKLKNLK